MTKKVGLILYGQPRFVETGEVYENHLTNIINRYDTDVFAQMWYSSKANVDYGEKSSWAANHGAQYSIANDAFDIVVRNYAPVKTLIEAPRTWDVWYEVESFTDEKYENSEYYSHSNMSNIVSQCRALEHAVDLVDDVYDQYDFFVLARYDALLVDFPKLDDLDNRYFHIPNGGHFNDLVHIFGKEFVGAGRNPFENLADMILTSIDIHDRVEIPIPEMYKYRHFCDMWGERYIRRLPMYADVIRNRG